MISRPSARTAGVRLTRATLEAPGAARLSAVQGAVRSVVSGHGRMPSPGTAAVNQEVLASIGLVLLFILIGGVFAATEIALVSLRESQLTQIAARSRRGERVAELANNPNRFLSAVLIGGLVPRLLSPPFCVTA